MPRLAVIALALVLAACSGTVVSDEPDAATHADAALPLPTDAQLAPTDAAATSPDAEAQPGRDASVLTDASSGAPDAASPGRDAAAPGVDASSPGLDAAALLPDASSPGLDAAAAGPDASTAICTGSGCIRPGSCPTGSKPARFVSQVAPGALQPMQRADVAVTFTNCGSATWVAATSLGASTGTKLGSQAPQDNFTWGANRFLLPGDVPVGSEVTVPFAVTAPATSGTYAFSFAILQESVAWLQEVSPAVQVDVADSGGPVTLCPGVTADPTGAARADLAIQQCIDATADGATLELPAGTYRMEGAVRIQHPMTLRTAGTAGNPEPCLGNVRCAVLRAAPGLDVANGFLQLGSTSGVVLDHLVLDGNRAARLGGSAAALCASGTNNRHGFNATSSDCSGCSFLNSASINAVCASGFEWIGDDATFRNSTFKDNGENAATNMWSDGLTLLRSDRAVVEGNRFVDNSDIDLICGGTRGGSITNNVISHTRQVSFAGLMLDNFNGSTHGDFAGAIVQSNTIDCGASFCHFGLMLGPHAWYPSANITGGSVTGNTIAGARQGINIEGAGTPASPIKVWSNPVSGNATNAQFLCGPKSCSAYNISPDSTVDRNGDSTPVTNWAWHDCP